MLAGDDNELRNGGQGPKKAVLVVVALVVLLAGLALLSRIPWQQDLSDRERIRDDAASMCGRLNEEPPSTKVLNATVDAFEDDKQLTLSVIARQVQSEFESTGSSGSLDKLRSECRKTYSV